METVPVDSSPEEGAAVHKPLSGVGSNIGNNTPEGPPEDLDAIAASAAPALLSAFGKRVMGLFGSKDWKNRELALSEAEKSISKSSDPRQTYEACAQLLVLAIGDKIFQVLHAAVSFLRFTFNGKNINLTQLSGECFTDRIYSHT